MNKQSYNEKSDIWSLGCLVYELCSLSPPFTAMNQRSLEAKIRIGKFRPIPERYSPDLSEVVNSMLKVNVSLILIARTGVGLQRCKVHLIILWKVMPHLHKLIINNLLFRLFKLFLRIIQVNWHYD